MAARTNRGPEGPSPAASRPATSSTKWWYIGLAITALAGLGIRLGYLFAYKLHVPIAGDPYYYHNGANLLATGHGFVQPFKYLENHQVLPGADHPPLYVIALAATSVVGFKSFLAHQIWSSVLSAAAAVVTGFAAREVAGNRAGLIAAAIAAVYPNYWLNDSLVLSESLVVLVSAVTVFVAYRFWRRPRMVTVIVLGAVLALGALTRAEMVLLVPVLLIPLTLVLRSVPLRRRLILLVVGGLSSLLVLAPWSAYNLSRFQQPTYISAGLQVVLVQANCDTTYYGKLLGFWSLPCQTDLRQPAGDLSTEDVYYGKVADDYIKGHLSRLPVVMAARVGRLWGFYAPKQQINLDTLIETRGKTAAFAGLGMYYGLAILTIPGLVIMWRRRVTIVPVVAVIATITVTSALIYGNTRFRAAAEVVLVLAASVALDALVARLTRRRRPEGTDVRSESPVPA